MVGRWIAPFYHISAIPSSSHSVPCFSVGPRSREIVLHDFLHSDYFPQAAFLHISLQHGNFLWVAVLQKQTAPACVPSTVSQVLSAACSRAGFPHGHSLLQQWSIHIGHGGSFYQLLTEGTPVVSPLPNPCHTNPMHLVSWNAVGIDHTCAFRMMPWKSQSTSEVLFVPEDKLYLDYS